MPSQIIVTNPSSNLSNITHQSAVNDDPTTELSDTLFETSDQQITIDISQVYPNITWKILFAFSVTFLDVVLILCLWDIIISIGTINSRLDFGPPTNECQRCGAIMW